MDREGVVWVSAVIRFLLWIEYSWPLALWWPVPGDCGVVCNIVVYTPIGQMNTKPTRGTIIGIGMLAALWIIGVTAYQFRVADRITAQRKQSAPWREIRSDADRITNMNWQTDDGRGYGWSRWTLQSESTNDGQWPAPLNVPQGSGVPVEQQ